MTEATPTNDKKMPNFENAIKHALSELLNSVEIEDIQEGHVGGIFPLVTLIKIATSQFTSVSNFIFKAPARSSSVRKVFSILSSVIVSSSAKL
jgi:hypothetical protein